jgi:hypothetical protein
MSANIPPEGPPKQLDKPREADRILTEQEVTDPPRLVRLLTRLLRDVSTLQRRWAPDRLDFEDVEVDATGVTRIRLTHNFRARVRWWVVDWTGGDRPELERHESSDDRVLVLTSHTAGTATIRVEKAD